MGTRNFDFPGIMYKFRSMVLAINPNQDAHSITWKYDAPSIFSEIIGDKEIVNERF